MSNNIESILLGSGKIYHAEFTGDIPQDDVIETEGNMLGLISGGATLEYKPEFYSAEDDLGLVKKTIVTKEDVTLKTGVCTFNGNTLTTLSPTARVTETAIRRTVKIGGKGNDNGKSYVLRFVHEDKVDGDVRITIVGKNEAGFTLAFAKDKETIVDVEIKALPHDTDGTLVIYDEEIVGALLVTSEEGSTSGKTKLTIAPSIETGHSYKYKTAESVTAPEVGDTVTGYTAWNGTDDITATTGHKVAVVEVDSSDAVIRVGSATVTSKT